MNLFISILNFLKILKQASCFQPLHDIHTSCLWNDHGWET